MRNILLTLSYDGTNFYGWQRQDSLRTVQDEIQKALAIIHKEPIKLYGSGRTDAGVHATAQAANFFSPIDTIPLANYVFAINSHLPHDIRIHSAVQKDDSFNARFCAVNRSYRYYLHCGESSPPAYQMPYLWSICNTPNLERLNTFTTCLNAEIDFASFVATGDRSLSTYRYIEKAIFFMEGEKLVFEIRASSFLWKMVRTLVGTFIWLEKKGGTADDFMEILAARDRRRAGVTAPAHGLFLWNIEFDGKRYYP